jgi:hypothetical protein
MSKEWKLLIFDLTNFLKLKIFKFRKLQKIILQNISKFVSTPCHHFLKYRTIDSIRNWQLCTLAIQMHLMLKKIYIVFSHLSCRQHCLLNCLLFYDLSSLLNIFFSLHYLSIAALNCEIMRDKFMQTTLPRIDARHTPNALAW